mmetsp:Transcript_5631/g.9711  ORF Transcript_5631/g.9711 Transcript_5631/m.9711 type:complete len:362 (-) Transcript_5631:94-1179(-)
MSPSSSAAGSHGQLTKRIAKDAAAMASQSAVAQPTTRTVAQAGTARAVLASATSVSVPTSSQCWVWWRQATPPATRRNSRALASSALSVSTAAPQPGTGSTATSAQLASRTVRITRTTSTRSGRSGATARATPSRTATGASMRTWKMEERTCSTTTMEASSSSQSCEAAVTELPTPQLLRHTLRTQETRRMRICQLKQRRRARMMRRKKPQRGAWATAAGAAAGSTRTHTDAGAPSGAAARSGTTSGMTPVAASSTRTEQMSPSGSERSVSARPMSVELASRVTSRCTSGLSPRTRSCRSGRGRLALVLVSYFPCRRSAFPSSMPRYGRSRFKDCPWSLHHVARFGMWVLCLCSPAWITPM